MALSFVLSHSVFHILQIICFSVLFARLCISTTDKGSILTSSARNTACIILILDYLIWSSSRFWSPFITNIVLSDHLSNSHFLWCKLLSIFSFIFICMAPDEVNSSSSSSSSSSSQFNRNSTSSKLHNLPRIVKVLYVLLLLSSFTIHHSPFTNFSIVLIFSLYHFVNSPFGIIVQNALIVIFTFFYPSIFTMILLILSTLNMSLSNPDKFENGKVSWIVISPQPWTQSIMLMYVISFSSTCHISDNLVI